MGAALRRVGRSALPSFLAIGILVLAACGGSQEPAAETSAPSEPATTAVEEPSPTVGEPVSIDVGQTFWFAGFRVELAAAVLDPESSTVTIDATFENLGSTPAAFDGTLSLASGGRFYESSIAQELPTVPGQSTGSGSFVLDVDDAFSFDDAVLTIGTATYQQAVASLGGTTGTKTLEPRTLAIEGGTKAGVLSTVLTGGELRADVPDTHAQMEAGKLALTLTFDVTNEASYEGGFAFAFGNNLALELPDGTTIAADDGPIELLALGTTLPDQGVRFTVPDPPSGTYALVLIDDTRDRRGRVEFPIP